MNTAQTPLLEDGMHKDEVVDALTTACGWIAPTWPLDQMIAVSPYWELRDRPAAEVTARLSTLARISSHQPADVEDQRTAQDRDRRFLTPAARELGLDLDAVLGSDEDADGPGHWHNVSDLLDSDRDREHRIAWRDEITQQISQFCAAAFQSDGPVPTPRQPGELYARWLDMTREDRGIPILMGEPRLGEQFARLPETPRALLREAAGELELPVEHGHSYGHALLLDINGWASWVAYLRWQDRLGGGSTDLLPDLLAIRLAWDLALWRHTAATDQGGHRRCQFLWRRQLA